MGGYTHKELEHQGMWCDNVNILKHVKRKDAKHGCGLVLPLKTGVSEHLVAAFLKRERPHLCARAKVISLQTGLVQSLALNMYFFSRGIF